MISTTNTAAMHSTSENLDSAFSTYMIVCYKRSCDLGNQRKPGCDSVYEFDPVAPEFYWLAHVAHNSGPVRYKGLKAETKGVQRSLQVIRSADRVQAILENQRNGR